MRRIKLTKGKHTIVDDADFEFLSKWKWCCATRGYAIRNAQLSDGGQATLSMARLIMLPSVGLEVDHINGDKLDNRRSNLRCCTRSENMRNVGVYKNNKSGYKGVGLFKGGPTWQARIQVVGSVIFLGLFKKKEDAARAYNEAALKYHGEFAYQNEVSE